MLHCSVREAQQRIDSREYAEWLAEFRIEPWGEQRRDWGIASLTAMMFNAWRGKSQKPKGASDFMPRFDRKEKISKPKAVMAYFRTLAAAMGAKPRPQP